MAEPPAAAGLIQVEGGLAVVVRATAAQAPALLRTLAALDVTATPPQVWVVVMGRAADGTTDVPLPAPLAAWRPKYGQVTWLACRDGLGAEAAAANLGLSAAFAAPQVQACVLLQAGVLPAPGLRQAYARALTDGPRPWGTGPGLWVGENTPALAAEPSPLAHFLGRQLRARQAQVQACGHVPADALAAANWTISREAFAAAKGLDEGLPAGLEAVDLARRLYREGGLLRACPAAKARWSFVAEAPTRTTPSGAAANAAIFAAVAAWRAQGRALLRLQERHQDPHGRDRLAARLGPFRALLPSAEGLAQRLQQVEAKLVALRRPQAAAIAELQPALGQLYGTSVLQGLLADPDAHALWPVPVASPAAAPRPARA